MVTIEQAKQDIAVSQEVIRGREQQLQQARSRLESQRALRSQDRLARQQELKQLSTAESQLSGTRTAIEGYEQQVQQAETEYQKQVEAVKKQNALIQQQQQQKAQLEHDYKVGRKFANRPQYYKYLTERQRKFAQSEHERQRGWETIKNWPTVVLEDIEQQRQQSLLPEIRQSIIDQVKSGAEEITISPTQSPYTQTPTQTFIEQISPTVPKGFEWTRQTYTVQQPGIQGILGRKIPAWKEFKEEHSYLFTPPGSQIPKIEDRSIVTEFVEKISPKTPKGYEWTRDVQQPKKEKGKNLLTYTEEAFDYGAEKYLDTMDKIYEKTGVTKQLEKYEDKIPTWIPKPTKAEAIEVVSDLGKWTVFSPFMMTTGELVRTLPKTTGIVFEGAEQTGKGNLIVTDIKYITTTGQRGTTRAVTGIFKPTKVVTPEDKIVFDFIGEQTSYGVTVLGGKSYTPAIEYKAGQQIVKKLSDFMKSGRDLTWKPFRVVKQKTKNYYGLALAQIKQKKVLGKKVVKDIPKEIKVYEELEGAVTETIGATTKKGYLDIITGKIKYVTEGVRGYSVGVGTKETDDLVKVFGVAKQGKQKSATMGKITMKEIKDIGIDVKKLPFARMLALKQAMGLTKAGVVEVIQPGTPIIPKVVKTGVAIKPTKTETDIGTSILTTDRLPATMGGTQSSQFAGTGLYETFGVGAIPKVSTTVLTGFDTQERQREGLKMGIGQVQDSPSRLKPKQNIFSSQQFKTAEAQRFRDRYKMISEAKSRTGQKYRDRYKQTTSTTTTTTTPRITKYIIKYPFEDEDKLQRKKTVKTKTGFDVYVRKRGEWLLLQKELPFGRALKTGATRVKQTLRASFMLRPSVKPTKIKDIPFKLNPRVFRAGKKTPLTFIQKSGTRKEPTVPGGRLASIGERREIQLYSKRKKIKW